MIMKHFQEFVLHKTKHNPAFSHTYFDPKFVHWSRTGSNKLQGFFEHVNSLTLAIQFTMTHTHKQYYLLFRLSYHKYSHKITSSKIQLTTMGRI